MTFSPTSGPTRGLDEANILALEGNTLSHRASTSVLGKKFVGMKMDVQTKANAVPSRSDALFSMIQHSLWATVTLEGLLRRRREICLLVLGAET